MSRAGELFFSIPGLVSPGDGAVLGTLREAASEWRKEGRHFSAGFCESRAVYAAWGTPEVERVVAQSVEDFRNSVNSQASNSLESVAALLKWESGLRYLMGPDVQKTVTSLEEELAQRLVTYFADSPNADSYLVRGFVATTDLEGSWEPLFPELDTSAGVAETWGAGRASITIPSAFQFFVSLGDYRGALRTAELCPDAFRTPGLRGWNFAVRGFTAPGDAVELFTAAADAFAEDKPPAEGEFRNWSSINIDLRSKYFRARALIARIGQERGRVHELIQEACLALDATDAGWVDPHVSRFRILLNILLQLVDPARGLASEQARQDLLREGRFREHDIDPLMLQFVDTAAQALDEFRADPSQALTTGRLHFALELLGRIPLIDSTVVQAITPAIGNRVFAELTHSQRTWIYRTLEAITDEAILRKIILRLAQASLPLYAQVRHGPIEYGKDVAVLLEIEGRRVLRLWQAKCGNITTPKWNASRDELEQMFLVSIPELQIGGEVDAREGILVCNGHANPYVEPIMNGWFAEQRRTYGRQFTFMHLDRFVTWIANERLIDEFRSALDELGIKPVIGGEL